jgi:hypothetical protein
MPVSLQITKAHLQDPTHRGPYDTIKTCRARLAISTLHAGTRRTIMAATRALVTLLLLLTLGHLEPNRTTSSCTGEHRFTLDRVTGR